MQKEQEKTKLLLELSYFGTGFYGWQYQPNKISVQQVLEEKLSYLFNTEIHVKAAGRTDAGVHAVAMPVILKRPETPYIPIEKLKNALNGILPKTLYIKAIHEVGNDFDPRFDAVGKAYTYVLATKDPGVFTNQWCWQPPFEVEAGKIKKAAKYLVGEHDFSSFAVALNKTKKNPVRTIYRVEVDSFSDYICITFLGKSFLYKMVRSLVGSIVYCSQKKGNPEEIKDILNAKDRSAAYKTVPPNGLFLVKVFYNIKECKKFKLEKLPFLY